MRYSRLSGRRTKIVCTLGPATSSAAMIERLIRAGLDVARLNLSHGTFIDHARYIRMVRSISQRLGRTVAILLDLPGPKYRVGKLKDGQVTLKKGAQVRLTDSQIEGDSSMVPLTLPSLYKTIKTGDTVFLGDGAIRLKVLKIDGTDIVCRVIAGNVLTQGRGVVVPGMRTPGPFITDSLRENILFAVEQQPDYLALSFVSGAQDIASVKELLLEKHADIPVIAKIERGEAVHNFSHILQVSDGIMVARGDLGVEIPIETVPLVQKETIKQCNHAGKPVITATEMLKSMVDSVRPTRAETTDVANAIFDGTDAIMLSEETSIGSHPIQAVEVMNRIARETEHKLPYLTALAEKATWFERNSEELISYNACVTADRLGARAIAAFTQSGSTAKRVSKYRPRSIVLGITINSSVARKLVLYWGVIPYYIETQFSLSELFSAAANLTKKLKLAKAGDLIVITAGIPFGVAGSTNLLKVEKIE